MKIILKWILALSCLAVLSGCNDEWKDEQYAKYLSFIRSGNGDVTRIYVKYDDAGGVKDYIIPVHISGSKTNNKNINANVAIDNDTLALLNFEKFRNRTDLYYLQLTEDHYEFETMSTTIPAGKNDANLSVRFKLEGLDTYHEHILPLKIDESSDLRPNPNRWYRRTLMNVILFNDFSGKYSQSGEVEELGNDMKLKIDHRNMWVVDENTVFFYAGITEEDAYDRRDYIIDAYFDRDEQSITLTARNPAINLTSNPRECSFFIVEQEDPVDPNIIRRYVMANVSYEYDDLTNPSNPIRYKYVGPMVMERVIDTLKPEEDQITFEVD